MTHRTSLPRTPPGRRWHGALAALCALALLAAACSSEDGASAPRTTIEAVARTTTSVAPSTTAAPAPDVNPELLFVALTPLVQLDQPVAMTARSGTANLYVAERSGIIRVIEISENRDGELETELVDDELLDIEDDVLSEGQEQGLLGITFSTDGRRLYVSYTNLDGHTRVDEYKMETDSRNEEVDERSRREILAVDQPFPNHNGGHLAFGPDGFLYIGLGDGGGAGDPLSTGQNPDDLLGSILRLDPDTGDPDLAYDIPTSNPFSLGGGTPEVWLYGARNPWRFSFDLVTGDLWVADVGQNEVEEINRLPAIDGGGRAANLGWAAMEGNQPFEGADEPDGHVPPIHTYGREDGNCSVTGGYVYRGTRIGGLAGSYVYGDFCRSTIRALLPAGDSFMDIDLKLAVTPQSLGSFGEGPFGELYALETIENGQIYRIDPFVF